MCIREVTEMARDKNWLRLYSRMPRSPEIVQLEIPEKWTLICLWCLASEYGDNGMIPYPIAKLPPLVDCCSDMLPTFFRHYSDLGLITIENDRVIIKNWIHHQYQCPSKTPSAKAAQKRKERESEHKTGAECRNDVGTMSERCRNDVGTMSPSRATESESESTYIKEKINKRENPTSEPPGMAPKARSRETPIPGDFALTEKLYEWCAEKDLSRKDADRTVEEFVCYYQSNGKTHIDWAAAFRKWVLNQIRYAERGASSPSANGSTTAPENSAPSLHPGFTTPMAGLPENVRQLARDMEERKRKIAAGEVIPGPPPIVRETIERIAAEREAKERAAEAGNG
jgi:hypothetical protein